MRNVFSPSFSYFFHSFFALYILLHHVKCGFLHESVFIFFHRMGKFSSFFLSTETPCRTAKNPAARICGQMYPKQHCGERSSHCSAAIQCQQWCCSKNKCFAKEKRVAAFLEWRFFMFSSPALGRKWCHQASTATTITIKSHRHSLNKKPQTDERIWNEDERMRWLYCCFQWPFSHDLLGVSSILLKNGHFIHFYFKPLERLSPPFCGWSGTFHDACISTNSPLSMSIFFFFLFAPFRWTCSRTLLHLRSIVCFTQKPLLSLSHWCSLFFLLGWSHRWLCPPPHIIREVLSWY